MFSQMPAAHGRIGCFKEIKIKVARGKTQSEGEKNGAFPQNTGHPSVFNSSGLGRKEEKKKKLQLSIE